MMGMMGSAAPSATTSPDLQIEFLRVLVDIATMLRDGEPLLSKLLSELADRERSVVAREAAVEHRERVIRQALRGME